MLCGPGREVLLVMGGAAVEVSGAPSHLPLLVSCLEPLTLDCVSSWNLGSPKSLSLSLTFISLDQSGSGILMGPEFEKIKYSRLLVERQKEN